MKERTIELLKYAGMKMDYFEPVSKRQQEWDRLCAKYSEKAVYTKLYELANRGYTTYGTSPRGSWLESKGKETLEKVNKWDS